MEKSKTSENTYVVTYKGEHNHKKPGVNQNSVSTGVKPVKPEVSTGVKPEISTGESEVPYTSMEFIGSSDDDVILIPNMTPMLEDLLMV